MAHTTGPILLFFLAIGGGAILAVAQEQPPTSAEYRAFGHPERVAVGGYEGEVVDPFLSRDGRYLFFNTTHFEASKTGLHYADRLDDVTFVYRGISVLDGFVEAQTLSPDGRSLYYQKREGDRFQFYRVTRAAVGARDPSQSAPSSENAVAKIASLPERLKAKVERVKEGARKRLASGGDPSGIFKAMEEQVKPLIDVGKPLEAEVELDRILKELADEKP